MSPAANRRILTVDDMPSIHEDFRKILGAEGPPVDRADQLAAARAAFLGTRSAAPPAEARPKATFELDSALQGEDALALVEAAVAAKRPYAVAFVDIRMPPGWDGVHTIRQLWRVDPDLQCVICTAYSDYSWEETVESLGRSDRLLILKKPFDSVEIRQLATALTEKWNSSAREKEARRAIEAKEAEARAYAASLETANQALRTSKASAERAADARQAFLDSLTRDVEGHVAEILAQLTEQIGDDPASGPTAGLEPVLDRSRLLMSTVTRALDLARIEQGALDVSPARCDLAKVVGELEAAHRPAAVKKGVFLVTAVAPDVPRCIECDPMRLAQVLDQLVANAIRFTERGRVQIRVKSEPSQSWDAVRLRFDVEDTGHGIPPTEASMLFEPFSAKDRGTAVAGSGLGLAVAKQVARLLGGDVTFEPNPSGGCTFRLSLDAKRL